jgi:hypothetical protein
MRHDLLALTAEHLALFSNLGLVKRAQKEVEAGQVPDLEELDGLVTARSRDGATTRLPPDVPLKGTSCTCGAAMCRHRLAAVLAYQKLHGPAVATPWDPGSMDDAALVATCGEAAIAKATRLLSGSMTVRLHPGPSPSAQLPTATVQFVVPMKLAFARCDCAQGHGCEHVVLAVWAFRRVSEGSDVVELGQTQAATSGALLVELEAALVRVVGRGLVELGSDVDLSTARARADRAGLLWVVDAFEDLERQRDAWERRSATFSAKTSVSLIAEIVWRLRAAKARTQALAQVLGSGEARETVTDQLRLTPLGVRVRADGERRFAELYLADRDSRQTYVLAKQWPAPSGPAKNGAELGELYGSSRLTLSALARADLVARAATRRANGHIDLALARGLKSSTLPGQFGWSDLPAPIAIDDISIFERLNRDAVPALLGPRRVGAHVHVVRVGRVVDLDFARGDQVLTSLIEDPSGGRLLVKVAHRSVSPGAVDATAAALSSEPRFISGELLRASGGLVLAPLAILGARLVVPDLERPNPSALPAASVVFAAEGEPGEPVERTPLDAVLDELTELLGRVVLRGLATAGPLHGLARRLADVGLTRVSDAVAATASAEALLDLIAIHEALERAR